VPASGKSLLVGQIFYILTCCCFLKALHTRSRHRRSSSFIEHSSVQFGVFNRIELNYIAAYTAEAILAMNVSSSNGSNGVHTQNGARAQSSASAQSTEKGVVDTEFLIVGAGPAGAALACFLASFGIAMASQFNINVR
jgi:alkyl hydroperoxide reductase subunit AhpF